MIFSSICTTITPKLASWKLNSHAFLFVSLSIFFKNCCICLNIMIQELISPLSMTALHYTICQPQNSWQNEETQNHLHYIYTYICAKDLHSRRAIAGSHRGAWALDTTLGKLAGYKGKNRQNIEKNKKWYKENKRKGQTEGPSRGLKSKGERGWTLDITNKEKEEARGGGERSGQTGLN